jgi:hypothetical protein
MSKLLKTTLMGAAAAVAIGAFAASANAAPITFTWNPSVVTGVAGEAVTANNINIADFAYATIQANGSFTESGVLEVTQFQNGVLPQPSPGLLAPGGYGLYFTFTASGTINNWNPLNPGGTGYVGGISSLSYNFLIDPTNNDSILNTGTSFQLVDAPANDSSLATGAEAPGLNQVTLNSGIPGANSTDTFVPNPANAAFFVNPTATQYLSLLIEDSFTNTPGVATVTGNGVTTQVVINGGGGNADFAVPEPATLSIFGAGLVALGFAKRRQKKKQA